MQSEAKASPRGLRGWTKVRLKGHAYAELAPV